MDLGHGKEKVVASSHDSTPESSPISSPRCLGAALKRSGTVGGVMMPAKPLSRTMSFLDVRTTSSTDKADDSFANVPRRILRTATFSESKDMTSRQGSNAAATATATLDRMFFSYLKKLLLDLCELKLRQKRRAAEEKEVRGRGDSQSPVLGESTSTDDDDEGEASGFYIGGD